MTDDEYKQYLAALAARHVSAGQQGPKADLLRREIARISTISRLVEDARDSTQDAQPSNLVVNELAQSPVDSVKNAMEATGILDALDETPTVTFGEFRRDAIPDEDFKILRHLGYSEAEIHLFVTLALANARVIANELKVPSEILKEASHALKHVVEALQRPHAPAYGHPSVTTDTKKKRKMLGGIGKLLGGAAAGIGNVLLLTGSIAAPPTLGAAVIASCGFALSTIFAGVGDLRGE